MGLKPDEERFRAPEKLSPTHRLEAFESGNSQLDDWLKRRAWKNEQSRASRTYILRFGDAVAGYYCLANGAVALSMATGRVRRNMPDPIPVMIIGRLAVDRRWQGQGIGRALLRDAVLRTLQAAEIAGIRAILAQAISEEAKAFYLRCGFMASPLDPMIVMIKVEDAEELVNADP